ncbi:MAG: hypothetical protein H0T42_04880 [Deltaproteobacteria bacterium]|nr:hypothetical protein [Deltaproteobacteria bacterium]
MHRLFSIPALGALFTAALGGCAADNGDEGIFITSNVVPGEGCALVASAGEPFLSHGTFSVFSRSGYEFHPQMKSRIIATATQIDARTIIMEGARVTLTFPDESVFSAAQQDDLRSRGVMRFSSLFSAPLPPNGGLADGSFDIITTALLDELVAAKGAGILAPGAPSFRAEVVATVVVYGDMSGEEVTSQEFQYPVTICNDCVVNVLGSCPLPAGTTLVNEGNSCNPYQDGVADCCRMGDDVVCPATVAPPPPPA